MKMQLIDNHDIPRIATALPRLGRELTPAEITLVQAEQQNAYQRYYQDVLESEGEKAANEIPKPAYPVTMIISTPFEDGQFTTFEALQKNHSNPFNFELWVYVIVTEA